MTRLAQIGSRAALEGKALATMVRSGALGLELPHRLLPMIKALTAYGTVGASVRVAALRNPGQRAVLDDRGELTYAELDEAINRLAHAFRDLGLRSGEDTVGILCRNGRAPLVTCFAASRAGLKCVWLNTGFAPAQALEVAQREGVDLLVHDAEFADVVAGLEPRFGLFAVSPAEPGPDPFDDLIGSGRSAELPPRPEKPGKIILLTSGTTGTPKGAPRSEPKGFVIPASLLERMPMQARGVLVVGPPIFHGTGLLITLVGVALGMTLVLRGRFDPEQMLDDIEAQRADSICVVPIMLQRILSLGEEAIAQRDLSSLKVAFTAGSQLHPGVAAAATEVLGEVIYNLYGSTEVSVATLATPEDVRLAPTSVGKPALGVTIRLFDEQGREVPSGETGRVFVGATMQFEGYTGGGTKHMIDGLMATGDVGHFDDEGRLYIDGRDDEMIVSGGENVFPREVEELLIGHPAVADVAVVGADDEEFGQRLSAFVVLAEGQSLSEVQVRDLVKQNLARYKVPRHVVFLDELPRNPTGKVLKRVLATYEV